MGYQSEAVTHGGRSKSFTWQTTESGIHITNQNDLKHSYSYEETRRVLKYISESFGNDWFPLANNVEKMYLGTEIDGLGSFIYKLHSGDILHAQGASYLGVVLEEIGILEWNGNRRGIRWRLIKWPLTDEELLELCISPN